MVQFLAGPTDLSHFKNMQTMDEFPASYSMDIGGGALSSGYSGQGVKILLTST